MRNRIGPSKRSHRAIQKPYRTIDGPYRTVDLTYRTVGPSPVHLRSVEFRIGPYGAVWDCRGSLGLSFEGLYWTLEESHQTVEDSHETVDGPHRTVEGLRRKSSRCPMGPSRSLVGT